MNTEINPTDWHNTRYTDYIPDHFVKLPLPGDTSTADLLEWLSINTSGRFSIIKKVLSQKRDLFTLSNDKVIGFELAEDATIFTMFYNNRNKI